MNFVHLAPKSKFDVTIVMIIMTMKIIMSITIIIIIMIKQVRDQPRFHPSGRPHQLDDRCRLEHCGGKEEADTGDNLGGTDDALDFGCEGQCPLDIPPNPRKHCVSW